MPILKHITQLHFMLGPQLYGWSAQLSVERWECEPGATHSIQISSLNWLAVLELESHNPSMLYAVYSCLPRIETLYRHLSRGLEWRIICHPTSSKQKPPTEPCS